MSDKDMEATRDPKKKVFEIFKDFMTGITKLEELGNAGHRFLLGFQQGLGLLQRPPIDTSSKLVENIIKNNETRRLKSYIKAGCINTHDAAQSTKTSKSLLVELERLAEDAALAIETATEEEADVREYGVLIAIVYSMVKQNYAMQEKIVKSLGLKSSSGELEAYALMWSLKPFVEEEIVNQAWKLIP